MAITTAALFALYGYLRWRASSTADPAADKRTFFEGHTGHELVIVMQDAELLHERRCVIWSAGPAGVELEHAGRRVQLSYGQIHAVKDGERVLASWS
jgi:hypothetical protein